MENNKILTNIKLKLAKNNYISLAKNIEQNIETKSKDLYYQNELHLEAQSGLLNDPNGLVFYNDFYYIFFQNSPHANLHDLKFWSLYKTKDFLNFAFEGIKLAPSIPEDADGIYSGGALNHNNNLYLFYTGNVKNYYRKNIKAKFEKQIKILEILNNIENKHFMQDKLIEWIQVKLIKDISQQEESYILISKKDDKENFNKKLLFKRNAKFYTRHFRDPKPLFINNKFYLFIGAQQQKFLKGLISVYYSNQVDKDYVRIGDIKFLNFDADSYMIECPEFFSINNKDILIFSTQGKKYFSFEKNNESIHNAIYLIGKMNWNNLEFTTEYQGFLDYGFDFYAPQLFSNIKEKIMYGWAGRPDISFANEKLGWAFNLTIPRKIELINNNLIQKPILNLEKKSKKIDPNNWIKKENGFYEIDLQGNEKDIEIKLFNLEKAVIIKINLQKLTFEVNRKNMEFDYAHIFGNKWLRYLPKKYSKLNLIIDNSLINLYFNEGEFHFTFYYFIKNAQISFINIKNIIYTKIKKLNIRENNKSVFLLGEALIDKYSKNNITQKEVGGAPLNVALVLSKKNIKNNFFGAIGNDENGKIIQAYFNRNNLSQKLLLIEKELKTTVVNVNVNKEGERDFIFNRGADENLKIKNLNLINDFDLFCFSSATAFLGGELFNTYQKILDKAFKKAKNIVFDPNYRINLFQNKTKDFIEKALYFISKSNVVKMSLEELEIIFNFKWTNENDNYKLHKVIKKYLIIKRQFFLITLGKKGTLFVDNNKINIIPSIKVNQIDTTGAGDVFLGSFISKYLYMNKNLEIDLYYKKLFWYIKYANINGALATTVVGVENAIKSEKEINELIG